MDKKSFIIIGGLFFTLSFSVSATAALIPAIAKFFKISPLLSGRLVWVYMLPYGFFALLWAPLSRKLSIKKMLLFSLAIFSLSSFLVGASPNFSFAFLGRLGMGIFGSSFIPLSLIIIGKELSYGEKSKYVGLFFSFSFSASLIGLFLSGILHWRLIYIIPSLCGGAVFFLARAFLRDFEYKGRFRISYVETFKNRVVLKLFIFIFLGSFLYHSVQQWLGVYLSQKHFFVQFFISSAFTVSSLVAIFSESMGGFLASKIGAERIASLGLLSMAIFIFSLLIFKIWWMPFVAIAFWGLGWAFNHVGLSSLLTNLPDKFLRDASSLNSSLRFLSGGLGTLYGAKIISRFHFNAHFLIAGILILILARVLWCKPIKVGG